MLSLHLCLHASQAKVALAQYKQHQDFSGLMSSARNHARGLKQGGAAFRDLTAAEHKLLVEAAKKLPDEPTAQQLATLETTVCKVLLQKDQAAEKERAAAERKTTKDAR